MMLFRVFTVRRGAVFWGGREGYQCLLNTCLDTELKNMANFFKMVVGKTPGT